MLYSGELLKYEDVMSQSRSDELYNHFRFNTKWNYGEVDYHGIPPAGMTANLFSGGKFYDEKLHNEFLDILIQKHDWFKTAQVQRSYVNLFAPQERTNFHVDGNCVTALFYISNFMNANDGGETQFVIDGDIVGVLPLPNRLVIFDGMLLHKATSYSGFRQDVRITVAFKFKK